MWVFTETGFVSAVASEDDAQWLVVRARDRRSLEPLAALDGDQIIVGAGTDYPYRLLCERPTFASWLSTQANGISYTNFKDRVHTTRGDEFADALMDVWGAMCSVTDDEGRGY
ncbi:MAG: hypothetical protein RJB65_1733 [Actinomycetota bacterium]